MTLKCENSKSILNRLKYLYGRNDIKAIDELKDYFKCKSCKDVEYLQEILFEYLLNDPTLIKYKGSFKYRKNFIKNIISIIETNNEEVNENILNYYIQLISSNSTTSEDDISFLVFYDKVN
jgi:hypothetical protein